MENTEEENLKQVIQKFKENISYLWSKWLLISIVCLICGALGIVKSVTTPILYKSSLSLVLEEDGKSSSPLGNIASSIGFGGLGSQGGLFTTSNILEYLKTRQLFEQTLLLNVDDQKARNTTFAELYIKSKNWRDKWRKSKPELAKIHYKVGDNRADFSLQKDSILGVIFKTLIEGEIEVAKPSEENSIIQINLKSDNEVFSKKFPEKLVSVVSDFYINSKTSKAKMNVDILQKQVDSVRSELYSSLSSAAQSSDQIFGLNPALNTKKTPYAKKQIDVQTNNVILGELVKNLEVSKMNLLNQTPFIQVIDRPVYPLDQIKLGLIKATIIGMIIGFFIIVVYLVVKRYLANL